MHNTDSNITITSLLSSKHLIHMTIPHSIHFGLSHYISVHPTIVAQYILPWTCNTANSTSCRFSIHLNTFPLPQLIHPGAIINTSFRVNISCQENNTSNTSFNTLEYILPFFETSDVLDDVLDVLTSNTSFDTSQYNEYILLIFWYIPILVHPACIGMCWMLIHPQYIPGDLLMFRKLKINLKSNGGDLLLEHF